MRITRPRYGRVEALTVKPGPTESGKPSPPPTPVGGELVPIDKLSVFLSNYWLLILLILFLPVALLLYKKRNIALKLLTPIIFRFSELRRIL